MHGIDQIRVGRTTMTAATLPCHCLIVDSDMLVDVVGYIIDVHIVDEHLMLTPVWTSIAVDRTNDAHAHAKGDADIDRHVIARRLIAWWRHPVHGWLLRPPPIAINDDRVVIRDIENLRIDWFDDDDAILLHNALLTVRRKRACALGFHAQSLHGVHHIILLRQEGLAQALGPVEFVIHHGDHGRKLRK